MYRNFRHFLRKNASGEVLQHAKRRAFPASDYYRQIKSYLNRKYRGQYLPDNLICEFEKWLDIYEPEMQAH